MLWYSLGIWNFIDAYFRNRIAKYLEDEYNLYKKPNLISQNIQSNNSLENICLLANYINSIFFINSNSLIE